MCVALNAIYVQRTYCGYPFLYVLLNSGFNFIRLLRLLHSRKLTRRGKYILTVNVALLIMEVGVSYTKFILLMLKLQSLLLFFWKIIPKDFSLQNLENKILTSKKNSFVQIGISKSWPVV